MTGSLYMMVTTHCSNKLVAHYGPVSDVWDEVGMNIEAIRVAGEEA